MKFDFATNAAKIAKIEVVSVNHDSDSDNDLIQEI